MVIDTQLLYASDYIESELSIDATQTNDKYVVCQIPWNNPNKTRFGFGVYTSNYNIAFGNSLHLFRIGKCLISPLIFSGYIEVDQEELYSKKKVVVILFYISGIIGNIILTIVAWRLHNYWGIWLIIYNISAIMVNVLPIAENNDVVAMYNYIKIESERGDQL